MRIRKKDKIYILKRIRISISELLYLCLIDERLSRDYYLFFLSLSLSLSSFTHTSFKIPFSLYFYQFKIGLFNKSLLCCCCLEIARNGEIFSMSTHSNLIHTSSTATDKILTCKINLHNKSVRTFDRLDLEKREISAKVPVITFIKILKRVNTSSENDRRMNETAVSSGSR